MFEKILGSECQKCIELYGYEEMRCAFCEEKAYYRDGLMEIKGFIPQKPKDCFECRYFGESGEHLASGKAHFPSLCEKDLLWLRCKGNEGMKRSDKK